MLFNLLLLLLLSHIAFLFQLIFLMVLIMYSGFVLTSISTEYYVQGTGRFFEYFVYIWRLGDLLEELIGYCVSLFFYIISLCDEW